jgi:phosphatidylserine decarboxylase
VQANAALFDQYLVLTLGDAKEATSVISKTLNPEWNQPIELPINGIHSLVLEVCCWDKDRFGKDYMGEFDVLVEEIFANGQINQEQKWYPLESRRTGKKSSVVTGEVLMQFSMADVSNPSATPDQIMQKFMGIASSTPTLDDEDEDTLARMDSGEVDDDVAAEAEEQEGEATKPEAEKRRRRIKLAKLKKKAKLRGYEFSEKSEVAGVLFLEVVKIVDLPPERNGNHFSTTLSLLTGWS